MAINKEKLPGKTPKGTEFVMKLPNEMSAYKLTTVEALDFEARHMGDYVLDEFDYEDVKAKKIEVYSIRDKYGNPRVTLKVEGNAVYNASGKGNYPPHEKYLPAVQEFIKTQDFDIKGKHGRVALLKQDGKYYDPFHLPAGFVVKRDLDLSYLCCKKLPDLSEVTVNGSFDCSGNGLLSLEGCPKKVKNFYAFENRLKDLSFGPQIAEVYQCDYNPLRSLVGAPQCPCRIASFFHTLISSLDGLNKDCVTILVGETRIKDVDAEIERLRKGYYEKKDEQQKTRKKGAERSKGLPGIASKIKGENSK